MADKSDGQAFMAGLAAPARRALRGAGISTPQELAAHSAQELLALHGFGPASLPAVRAALAEAGLALRGEAAADEGG